MSRLKVFWPDETRLENAFTRRDEVGSTVRFPTHVPRRRVGPTLDLVHRAQVLYENRSCPYCGYPMVEPIELDDGLVRNNLPIPGTATLVGFRCDCCRAEWPAAQVAAT